MSEKLGAGLCVNENFFYLDHLGIVCSFMEAPVLALEEMYLDLGKKYYPDFQVQQLSYDELTPDYLYKHFDVLYLSEYWNIDAVRAKFKHLEEKYQKQLRVVHCPHGFSDKSYWLDKCALEDIVLVYGQHMLDMFKNLKCELKNYVITGNYRYTYYKKHKAFYKKLIQDEVLSQFKKEQPIILYAPTWLDDRKASTFFEACGELIDSLPDSYNMIVKLHPGLERNDIAEYYSIIQRYDHLENVLFITEFPPVFPLLDVADIYIGDTSSVGYDFLMLDKPMFFLNKYKEDPMTTPYIYLYRCGKNIYPEEYSKAYSIIEKELPKDKEVYSPIRKEMAAYTFGKEKSFEEIRSEIKSSFDSSVQ